MPETVKASVVVVDDHAIFRMGVVQTLAMSSMLEVVGEAASSAEAISLIERLSPDVALIDISMLGNGLELLREVVRRWPRIRTAMLTVSAEDEDVFRAIDLGASGYILKGISAVDLVSAVEAIAQGQSFVSPSLGVQLMTILRHQTTQTSDRSLSRQELKVLRYLLEGKSNSEIASQMNISIKTVKFHFTNIFEKTGTNSRVALALKAADLIRHAERADQQS